MAADRLWIIDQLRDVLDRVTDGRLNLGAIREDARILDDLGLTSLELLELRFELESVWNVAVTARLRRCGRCSATEAIRRRSAPRNRSQATRSGPAARWSSSSASNRCGGNLFHRRSIATPPTPPWDSTLSPTSAANIGLRYVLSNAFAFGGSNACVLLEREADSPR
jgi:hypothetical protein